MLHHVLTERYPKKITLKDGTEVTLRPMVKEDKDALLEFFRKVPEEDRMFLKDDVTSEAVIEAWCRELDYDTVLPLLAETEGRIIADATLHQQKRGWMSHVGRIRVVVHPDHRHKGLATRMIQELIEIATDTGLEKLNAEFMAEQVVPLQVFERLGFFKAAIFPQHVRDLKGRARDLVVMVYDLLPPAESYTAQ